MKKMKHSKIIFLILTVMSVSVSCVKQKLETIYNSQESRIDKYIEKNRISGTDTVPIRRRGHRNL